jgi:hypothetical protein
MAYDSQAQLSAFAPYVTQKSVRAALITEIYSSRCIGVGPDMTSVSFDPVGKPTPQVGWFCVMYPDGYISFCPPEQFAESTRLNGERGFDWALNHLKAGGKVARLGWNGRNMHLCLQVPDAHSKMSLPYLYMQTAQGETVPWLCSQTDALAVDWIAVA